ncbi:MAG TPA: hypothetical protein VHS09_08755 [Polyangiaceae bacterium]|nr:hypothetical protein [Polyangiaceae bacterium]
MRRFSVLAVALAVVASSGEVAAEEEPTKWEQLFFPFPIVGAPPQLEQQVQVFDSYFRGRAGSGDVPSLELAYIASPHLGLVATVPFQVGFGGQTTGFEDAQLLVQWLAAGSLELDDMVSVGVMGTFPVGRDDLSSRDYYVGPFVYAAQRFLHHLIFEADVTTLLPVVHGDSTRQILGTALAALLLTPRRFSFPVYAQIEVDSTTYLGGTAALPPQTTQSPAETVFVAPEIFLGPFESPISDGTRVAAGVSFNVTGDPVHAQTYSLTAAFDIPNRYGY